MKKLLKTNNLIIIAFLTLSIISLVTLYGYGDYFKKQLLWIGGGLLSFFVIQNFKIKYIFKIKWPLYIFACTLLLYVILFGSEINGSKAWIDLRFFSIQPSEIAKVSLFILLPFIQIKKKNNTALILLTIIPAILTYLEPDTGAIIIYLIILMTCLLNNSSKKTKILLFGICISVIALLAYIYFKEQDLFISIFGKSIFYRLDRLTSFKNQDSYQLNNALISIGAHKCLYFPEFHTDFIFALILCKLNCFIAILLLLSFILIFIILILKINTTKNRVIKLYQITLFWILLFQVFQNILMNIGLSPIIGLPLPFISYGGSHIVSLYILFGISFNKDGNNSY